MFNSRNFLIGLGVGLLFSGFILIFFAGPSTVQSTPSLDKLKQYAKHYNAYVYTEEELNQIIEDAQQEQVVEKKPEAINFTISQGMASSEVANYLSDLGVLDDEETFLNLLSENDLTKKIIAKTYIYDEELSTEELVELITGTKKEDW